MLIEKREYKNVNQEKIESIREFLEEWCEDKSYNTFEVIVVLYELYNNAVKYSNAQIDIRIKLYPQAIVIRINDLGQGFDVKKRLDITTCDLKKNIHQPYGRGIYIVKNFTSRIYYNKKGNNVVVKIKKNE